MTANNQLTTLANVSAWLGSPLVSDGALLTRLISSASRFILGYINRSTLFQNVFNDTYDGIGQRAQMLRNFPVVSVNSVSIMGQSIPASPAPPQQGYFLDTWDGFPPGNPQMLRLYGHCFPQRMPQSIQVSYTAGFVVQNEAQIVPGTPYQVNVNAPYGNWGADQGVTYSNGMPFTPVSANPAQGQYVAPNGTNSYYPFAAADSGQGVLISYSYIPADLEQACIEMVAERYKYKNRIGEVSKSLGGQETMSYSQKDMSDFVKILLSPYRRIVPV